MDNGASKYTYDPGGDRVRKDTPGSNFTEYYRFGGNVLAEQDQAGNWTDYIFAGGKRIAKSDSFEDRIHVHAVECANCGFQWYQFNFPNAGGLGGRVIQAGDKLMWRQWAGTGTSGGVNMTFTDGTDSCCMGIAITDQNGEQAVSSSLTQQWNYRLANLAPVAGKTIAQFRVDFGFSPGTWDLYYQDIVYRAADGTVIPLYNHNPTISLSGFGSSGVSGASYEINVDANAGPYSDSVATMYYHGDQIGSSRLMTSGGGWPVWQGTFLPYGEEYNAQMSTNHYKFTGKERDDESGLDYFGARYYGNALGRFITPDWAAKATAVPYADFPDPQSLNLYTYVRNVPTIRIDQDGHDAILLIDKETGQASLKNATVITGKDATPQIISLVTEHIENLNILGSDVKVMVIPTDKPILGVLNQMDISPGKDQKMCGAAGECVNALGGNKSHIDSAGFAVDEKAAHDTLHFAGIKDQYQEGKPDQNGNRGESTPNPGYEHNIMGAASGEQLTSGQIDEAKKNKTTKQCIVGGGPKGETVCN